MGTQNPTIGRIVIYRTDGRNGMSYDLPAMVTCTRSTHPGDYPDGSKNPLPVPPSDDHVHLTVFTPGGFGTKISGPDALAPPALPDDDEAFKDAGGMKPGSGTYVEWNVPYAWAETQSGDDVPARSWRWPEIKK